MNNNTYISLLQHEYGDIVNWYMSQSRTYPDITGYVESIGKSVENRDMPALHISSRPMGTLNKIYFQCQIHASELQCHPHIT